MAYSHTYRIRWADLDPNVHMRHSAYNDYAAQARLQFMSDHGFGMEWFKEHKVFPLLFREETVFMREVMGNEEIRVEVLIQRITHDGSRWTMVNRFIKPDGTVAAKLTVDGAWIHPETRKLIVPPEALMHLFDHLDKTEDFTFITREAK
jgi:acyl-CoA thioester hydrolase